MKRPTILLVDDEPDLRTTLGFRLEQLGFSVETATNGFEALGAARVLRPDLMILDVMLPRENGYRVARLIREDTDRGVFPKRLPIILLTARDLSSDPEREGLFMEFSRADAVLYKPFEMDQLEGQIRRLLAA